MLADGGSRLAAELLGVLREERRRRPGAPCTPSIERLAALVACGGTPPSPRTVQRALAWLQRQGWIWRVYRGGRGRRSLFYLRAPRADELEGRGRRIVGPELEDERADELEGECPDELEGRRADELEGAAASSPAPAYPVIRDGVTGPHSLDLEIGSGKTKGGHADADAASSPGRAEAPLPPAPAPRAGERASAPPLPTLAAVWAIWLRVYRQRSGRQYVRRQHDGSAAIGVARRLAASGAELERLLTWNIAQYLRSGEHADEGAPLHRFAGWFRRHASGAPPRWDSARLRLAPLPAAPPRAPAPAPASSPASSRKLAADAFGRTWRAALGVS